MPGSNCLLTGSITFDIICIQVASMSRKDKREQKIRSSPSNVPLEDFEALVNQYGYIREGGKHPQAVIGNKIMSYKRTNPIKSAYVKQLLEYIDSL
jgi:hypothetical protein